MNLFRENKTFIFKVFVIFIFASLAIGPMHGGKYKGQKSDNQNVITVTGTGEIQASPDIANIYFTINKEGKTVKEAQDAVAEIEKKAIEAIKANSVDAKDIKTENASFNPKYDYGQVYCVAYPCPQKTPKIIGYEASESISVKIRNLGNTGKIIQDLGATGVSNLNGPNFAIDDEDGLKAKARKEAIDKAKEKAKTLAKDLGVRLGRIQSFTESGDYPIYYAKTTGVALDASLESRPAELPKGENTITSNVTIVYEIR